MLHISEKKGRAHTENTGLLPVSSPHSNERNFLDGSLLNRKFQEWVCTHVLEIDSISKRRKKHQLTWAMVSKHKNWSVLFKISLLENSSPDKPNLEEEKAAMKPHVHQMSQNDLLIWALFSFQFLASKLSLPLYPHWSHTLTHWRRA